MSTSVQTHTSPRLPDRGRVGMTCLIITESAFFSIFVVGYLFYIGKSQHGPQPADVLEFPWLATACLLSSSATIMLAVAGLRAGAMARFSLGLLATMVLGATFLGFTAMEWRGLIEGHGLTIRTNLFGTTFYSLVGFHAAHVMIGVLAMSLVLSLSLLGHVEKRHAERVELLSWYWHFVDAVWLAVLASVYVIGR
ncbi:heme-copper oxidase subunit III [Myxococcota bacterium]|nr:heme-copper oxidase subunit III [Myxococcota bacterium]